MQVFPSGAVLNLLFLGILKRFLGLLEKEALQQNTCYAR